MKTQHSYFSATLPSRLSRGITSISIAISLTITLPFADAWSKTSNVHGVPNLTSEQNFQVALEAQTERKFSTMLRHLRLSAESGNTEAQEMLGMVLLIGPNLYGQEVKVNRCEAGKWLRLAAKQGSYIAQYQLDFLNRLRNSPSGKEVCRLFR